YQRPVATPKTSPTAVVTEPAMSSVGHGRTKTTNVPARSASTTSSSITAARCPSEATVVEKCHGFAGALPSVGGCGGPCRGPHLGGGRGRGHEDPVRRSKLRLVTGDEPDLGQEPLPVLARVLAVHRKQPESTVEAHALALAEIFPAPREIGWQRLANPVVQHEDPVARQH